MSQESGFQAGEIPTPNQDVVQAVWSDKPPHLSAHSILEQCPRLPGVQVPRDLTSEPSSFPAQGESRGNSQDTRVSAHLLAKPTRYPVLSWLTLWWR